MKDILVTEDIAGQGMEALKEKFHVVFEPHLWKTRERLMEMIAEFRAVIVRNQTRVTSSMIGAASRLQVIGRAGGALDVRSEEPPDDSPLSGMDNVILTPHIGAFTGEGQERVVSSVCRDVAAVLNGKEPRNYFNLSKPQKGFLTVTN